MKSRIQMLWLKMEKYPRAIFKMLNILPSCLLINSRFIFFILRERATNRFWETLFSCRPKHLMEDPRSRVFLPRIHLVKGFDWCKLKIAYLPPPIKVNGCLNECLCCLLFVDGQLNSTPKWAMRERGLSEVVCCLFSLPTFADRVVSRGPSGRNVSANNPSCI